MNAADAAKQGRSAVALLVLAASTLVGIAVHEGYKDEAYIPVPGDVPTIGFGTTTGVKMGDKTTAGDITALEDCPDETANHLPCTLRTCLRRYEPPYLPGNRAPPHWSSHRDRD